MTDIWVISDTHFGHANMLKFTEANGDLCRPGFADVSAMNECMIDRWNQTVKPGDKVYHLGDVAFGQKTLDDIMPRLNGQKRLIMGNHDNMDVRVYRKYFKKIASWRQWRIGNLRLVMCHYPLHESSFSNRHGGDENAIGVCVHGHIHRKEPPPGGYINVCVEMIDYTPVHFDDLVQQARQIGSAD